MVALEFKGLPPALVPLELLPMLVPGSTYDNAKRSSDPARQMFKFTAVSSTTGTLVDSDQTRLAVINTACGMELHIRHSELARTLFIHNTHLARAAFRPSGLASLARCYTDKENFNTVVSFSGLSDYPVSYIRTQRARAHLAWMLFDQEAKKSLGSILDSYRKRVEPNWHFEFTPPSLKGWNLAVAGEWSETEPNKFLVQEVTGVENPSFQIAGQVIFRHPNLRGPKEGGGNNKPYPIDVPADQPDLDIPQVPKLGEGRYQETDLVFSFDFLNQVNSALDETKPGSSVRAVKRPSTDPDNEVVGTGHGGLDGKGKELNYGINQQSGYDEQDIPTDLEERALTPRARLFEKAVDRLDKKEGYRQREVKCLALPAPSNNSKKAYDTHSGKPPSVHMAQFYFNNYPMVVVEVDVECMTQHHSLGTRVLCFSSEANTALREVLQACSNKGVSWDKQVIDEFCSASESCKHPHRRVWNSSEPRPDEEYLQAWADAIHRQVFKIAAELAQSEEPQPEMD